MILFVSDCHLGRGSREATRAAERDLVACLRTHEAAIEAGGALVLVGDVFDQFIEYRHLVPKLGLRLLGLLGDWADRGLEVHYIVGNRDPWHVDVMERDLGVRLHRGGLDAEMHGRHVYIAHGDRPTVGPPSLFQSLLRSPRMARSYRMALPGDTAYAFARWVGRTLGTDGSPDPRSAEAVRARADERLRTTDADLVVLGHSHTAALADTPHGTYLNPGYWFGARTFARLDADGPALLRWADDRAEPLTAAAPAAAAL